MKLSKIKILVIMFFICCSSHVFGLSTDEKSAIKAIKTGDIELLKAYLNKLADVNCIFSNGKTGLYYAIVFDKMEICEFLLKNGANPNSIVSKYSTLFWALKYDRNRMLRFLVEYGADVNKTDKKGNTPLIYASKFNNYNICKILIDRGANPLYLNPKKKSASDFALYAEDQKSHKYLSTMETFSREHDSFPSSKDGPYIQWEAPDQIVITYFERIKEKNLTRLIEKTTFVNDKDTVLNGFGWDTMQYHIKHKYTSNPDKTNTSGNIFAIGDVHGRFNALVNLLMNNKIIDSHQQWIFGNGQLVMLGDVFDRGNSVTETLWFLYELQIQAQNSGGNVNLLLGNHEIMALTGDHRYLDEKYLYFTQYTRQYYFQLFDKNSALGKWLRSQNVILQINDNLFMHAGISPDFDEKKYSYPETNLAIQKYLLTDFQFDNGSIEDIILGANGPLWYRGYMNYNNRESQLKQQFVDDYLETRKLKHMILGHNEQKQIGTSFEGKVISVDVSINESGNSAQGLLLTGDKIYRCFSDGRREDIQ